MASLSCFTAPVLMLMLFTATLSSSAAAAAHERHLTAVGRGGGFGGFGSRASSKPATAPYRPAAPAAPYRPATPAAPPGRAFGSTVLPGGFSGYARPGFLSTPFILPLALGSGLLAGSAISTLNRNPNAYCNGISVQCYKAACEAAVRDRCPQAAAASNNTLVLGACPDSRYSECYRTPNFNNTATASFECFGVRRPRYGQEDLAAVCHQPGGSNSAGGRSRQVLHILLPFALAALLLVAL